MEPKARYKSLKKLVFFVLILLLSVKASSQIANSSFLDSLLIANKEYLGVAAEYPENYEVKIVYSQIDRKGNGSALLNTHEFRNDHSYFYPASTVKMPVAFLALEWLNEQNIDSLSENSPMIHGAMPGPYTARVAEASAISGWPSVAHDIKKIFLVSDNDSYNRLYELIGPEYINNKLYQKGCFNTRIWHRLSVPDYDSSSNQVMNPVMFLNSDTMIYSLPKRRSSYPIHTFNITPKNQTKGQAYLTEDDSLINKPFDFRLKNYSRLSDLHRMLICFILPNVLDENAYYNHTEKQRKFLLQTMSKLPRESHAPTFDQSFYDSYVKFFMFGDSKDSIPDHIKIFNKVGVAYGYLTDVAYIVDLKNNIDFFLSASIHVNANGIYNDGNYEYDETGIPFLARLGRVIYEFELSRKRNHKIDLTKALNLSVED